MDKMKIYITGGYGLVGRNIKENEIISKNDIIAPAHKELELLDYNAVYDFIKSEKPDIIIHTAGIVGGIVANMSQPYKFLSENLIMGANLVRASFELGIKKFLNLCSSCAYPKDILNPLKEDKLLTAPFEPTNEGYAIAKTAVLKMCEYISRENEGYFYKTLIPCNLYGRYDNFSLQNSHLIPAIIRKIHNAKLNNEKEITIWGDGNARREFMYAGDFAQIVSQILDKFDKIPSVMNIGLGYDYTINEYYEKIAEIIGYSGGFTHDLTKPSGMKQKLLDITNQNNFEIKSIYTLKQGIEETYKYFINEYKGE